MRLADLKRLPPGTKLRLVECLMGPVPEGTQLRTVEQVRSADIVMRVAHSGARSYLTLPKAADFRETADGFAIEEDGVVAARYVWDPGEEG